MSVRRQVGALGVCLVLAALVFGSVCSGDDELKFGWQPGFPLRAGPQVLLMWNPFAGAERYVVVRRNLSSGELSRWEVPTTQFVDTGASDTVSYGYVVQAILPGGAPGPSLAEVKLVVAAPLELPKWVGIYQEAGSVNLAWEHVDRAAFYNVYRAEGDGPPALLASVQDTKYVDAATKAAASYTYRLRAVGFDSRESKDSEPRKIAIQAVGPAAAQEKIERRAVEVVRSIQTDSRYTLREPTDLALSQNALFVTDVGSRSIVTLGLDGTFLYQFGLQPLEYPGRWGIPWGIGMSAAGERAAVTFMRSPNVRVFTRDGKLIWDFVVEKPAGYEDRPEVCQPMDVAFDKDGSLWVSEYAFGQLVHMSAEGAELGRVGVPRFAKEPGPFRSPTFLLARPDGGVYAVDSLLAEVFDVDAAGKIASRWRQLKGDSGLLNLPKGLAFTAGNHLLVVDGMRSSLQSFTPEGKLEAVYYKKNEKSLDLTGLVSAAVDPKSGEIYALSKLDSTIYRLRVVDVAPAK